MKNNLGLFIFILSFCLLLPRSNAEEELYPLDLEELDATISLDFQDAELKDILKIFSIQSGLNFIASESVQDRKITLYLDKVPIKQVMDKLFKANNLTYELDKDVNIFIVKDWGKPEIETITKVFYLKYATVSSSSLKEEMYNEIIGLGAGGSEAVTGSGKWAIEEKAGITTVVKKILSGYGSVIEDYRTNSLIVTDIPSRMPIITQTIASLDVPVPQVMLEVEMLDVSKNIVDKLGFEFGNNPFTLIIPKRTLSKGVDFFIGDITKRGQSISSTSGAAGLVSFGRSFAEVLDFLRTDTDTKTLARPRLLTLNNEPAEIKITTNEVIGEEVTYDDQGNVSSRTAERIETGVSLRVTPQINLKTGEITMFISPKVKEASTSVFSSSYRDPEERGTKSLVKVKDGETVILGGLIRNEFNQVITKVPLLGDIPILGALFRHKSKTKDRQRELLVFITPHIIKDTGIEVAQAEKVSLPAREQSLAEGLEFERQLTINTSLNKFEKIMK